jgi:hypothetical protein
MNFQRMSALEIFLFTQKLVAPAYGAECALNIALSHSLPHTLVHFSQAGLQMPTQVLINLMVIGH